MRRSCLALLALLACRSSELTEGGPPGPFVVLDAEAPIVSAAPPLPLARADASADRLPPRSNEWCLDGLSPLDEDACYVLPGLGRSQPLRLLVYLHGIVPPLPDSVQKRAVQNAVLRASVRAGAAALVPRGRRGIGPGQARDWWAWPTTSAAIDKLTPSIVAQWARAKAKLEAIAGAHFERTYLAGSSNGAYFLAAIAVRGTVPTAEFPIDGFGAMSGGAASPGAAALLAEMPPRPFYVGFGAYDEDSAKNARALAAVLAASGWPFRLAEHPLGHGANEVYLDEAFEFWRTEDATATGGALCGDAALTTDADRLTLLTDAGIASPGCRRAR